MVKGENVTESSSSYAFSAGIVGLTNDYATVTLENCYNAGNVDSGYTRIGALVGQAGKSTTIRNSYYLNNVNKVCASYYSNEVPADISATACAAEEFKAVDMLDNLGSAYKADGTLDCAINDGYPVLSWQVIPVHTHTLTETPAEAATCTTEGNIAYWTCSVCEKIFSDAEGTNEITLADTVLPLTGHSYTYVDNGDGTHTATCSVCNDTVTADHTFVDGTCVCGAAESVEDPYLDENLAFLRVDLLLESYLGVGFTIRNSVLSSYDSYYVLFEYERDGVSYSDHAELEALGKNYVYATHKVAAKEMTDTLHATIYAVDASGNVYHGNSIDWDVRSAMQTKLAAATDEKEIALCVAILNYGAAAQVNFSYKTDDLANNIVTEEQQAILGEPAPAVSVLSDTSNGLTGATYYRMSLSAESTIYVNPIMKFATGYTNENVICKINYTDSTGTAQTVTYSGDDIQKMGSRYYVSFDKMAAKQMRESFDITFYDLEGNAISETRTYSIASYIAENLETAQSSNPSLAALLEAVLAYGDAASAYFAQ